ncbi:hypothetical protein HJB52_02405 [Rhizobium lentis]|uniref:hypothetical protein n=1 Tax=Rhizobium lentis TaxID=1138194 RepID=UPI001C82B46F|nr:hypothetical protein [Rhizobium lentis]MBX5100731.1 hypothetical protein [Rhizobium lentis]MBX5147239.1 hypothetical protein [Rhizobium lentis]
MDIDLDRPEAIRSRVKRIVAGDFDYSHFATIIMWLRERVPKNSTLRELGDFLAHPCRERGPTSAAVNDLLMDVWDKLEGLDAKKLAPADWLIATVAAGFVREPLMYAAAPKLISFEG